MTRFISSNAFKRLCSAAALAIAGVSLSTAVQTVSAQVVNGKLSATQSIAPKFSTVPTLRAGKRALAAADNFQENGWYYNPAEAGTGFMFEAQGDTGFVSFFMYTDNGAAIWYAGSGTFTQTASGFTFNGSLSSYRGGQPASSGTPSTPTATTVGNVTINFSGRTAVVNLPGGRSMNAQRFSFNDITKPATGNQSEVGWFWNPNQSGRGYAFEVQNNVMFMAMFHYNADGSPTWNTVTSGVDANGSFANADFTPFSGGQTLTGTYKAPTQGASLGKVSANFSDPCTGSLTLPGSNTVAISRFGFASATPCRAKAAPAGPPANTLNGVGGVITSDKASIPSFTPRKEGNSTDFSTNVANGASIITFKRNLPYVDNNTPLSYNFILETSGFPTSSKPSVYSVRYTETLLIGARTAVCRAPCAGLTVARTADGGVVIYLKNATFTPLQNATVTTIPAPSSNDITFNGYTHGSAPNGVYFEEELPRGSSGTLTVGGQDAQINYTQIDYSLSAPSGTTRDQWPVVLINTKTNPHMIVRVGREPTSNTTTPRFYVTLNEEGGATPIYNAVVTASALVETSAAYVLNLSNVTVTQSVSPNASKQISMNITVPKVQNAITTGTATTIKGDFSAIEAATSTYTYILRDFAGGAFQAQVDTQNKVTSLSYTSSAGVFICATGLQDCGSVARSADKRTVTFSGNRIPQSGSTTNALVLNGSVTLSGR